MAKKTKDATGAAEFSKLKSDIASGNIGRLYVMKGSEAYLRDYYINAMKNKLLGGAMEEFNYRKLQGEKLTLQELTEAVDALPVFAERTFVEVRDFDLFPEGESAQSDIISIIGDIPDYCCLVFVYDTLEYRTGKASKVSSAVKKAGSIVEFAEQEQSDLYNWIDRRFAAHGHVIGRPEKDYLTFRCGSLMTGLIPEMEKISGYAKEKRITVGDIDAASLPVTEAVVFEMTDAISRKDYDSAAGILSGLLVQKEAPIKIIAIIGAQLRRIYFAKTAVSEGKNSDYVAEQCGIKDYPAKLAIQSAKRFSAQWCRSAVLKCADYDMKMKSSSQDDEELIKRFLLELALC